MTISNTSVKNSYTGNNSTATFNYTFKIFANSDLQVIIRNASGVETVKTITTHYTVAGAGNNSGGSITFTSGNIPTNTETVVIRRILPQTQSIDYIANDPFPAESHEEGLDRAMMTIQQVQEELDRSLKVSRTATLNTPEITDDASSRAGKLLGFSADGNSLDATIDGSGVATNATAAANSATAAATSASAAATSATAAENAKNAAEAALDTFDDDFLGAKSSNPTVDNDGNALADGALYFDTTNNVMKVYDLGNTQWKQLTPTTSQQTNIDAAVANATNINNVAGQISPTNNIATVAGDSSSINTLAGVSGLSALATAESNGHITNVSNNLSGVNSFAERYRITSSAPTSSLDVGDLYFDTTQNELKVYKSSGWSAAGSSVNGTSARFKFNITGAVTTLSGNDANGVALSYDAGFIDVYLNGVKQVNGTDVTVSSGNSIVFASALTNGDIVEAVAFGTFNVAAINTSAITAGTLPFARGGTGLNSLGTAGQVMKVNAAANALEFGNASSAEVYGFNLGFVASTVNYTVSVASYGGGNKFHILGIPQNTLELMEGNTYVFSYPSAHPFALSTTSDGTHGGGSEYTTGVTRDSSAYTLTYVVPTGAPQLYYYCTNHSGMGGTANTPAAVNNTIQVTTTNGGNDNISAATYAAFDDVIFAATGFTFSLSNGDLIATI